MRRHIVVATALVGSLALGACDHPDARTGDRQQLIIQAAIREVVDAQPAIDSDALPVVYVVRVGEQSLAATVQAEVIDGLHDVVDVTFADSRDEAIASDTEDLTVKNGGVLLLIGDIAEDGNRIELPIEVYVSDLDRSSAVYTVRRSGKVWTVVATSVVENSAS